MHRDNLPNKHQMLGKQESNAINIMNWFRWSLAWSPNKPLLMLLRCTIFTHISHTNSHIAKFQFTAIFIPHICTVGLVCLILVQPLPLYFEPDFKFNLFISVIILLLQLLDIWAYLRLLSSLTLNTYALWCLSKCTTEENERKKTLHWTTCD